MISKLTIYIGVGIGIIFQGEVALIGSGHLIYVGTAKFWLVVLIATLLSTINGEFFFIASKIGLKLFQTNFKDKISKVGNLIQKYKTFLLLFSRFIYGFRNIIPIAFGLSEIRHLEFSIFNFAGAFIWALTFTSIGLFSSKAVSIFIDVKRYQLLIFGISLGIAFTIAMFKIINIAKTKE
jgi:membrane protein DedA with SNARE-associated domain